MNGGNAREYCVEFGLGDGLKKQIWKFVLRGTQEQVLELPFRCLGVFVPWWAWTGTRSVDLCRVKFLKKTREPLMGLGA